MKSNPNPSFYPMLSYMSHFSLTLKGAKGTISLAQANNVVPGPNCILKSLWG